MWDDETAERQLTECVVGDGFPEGVRVDLFLARQFEEYSRVFFQKCLDQNRVYLNGRPCQRSCKVWPGNVLEIDWPPAPNKTLSPENIPLDIIMEDDDVIVLNKPAGLVVHPAHGNLTGTLVQGLLYHDEEAFEEMTDDTMRPGIVHRLDKDTSGVLVVAKNMEARSYMKEVFKEHIVEKTYLTIVLGEFGAVTGTIEGNIGRHPTNRLKMAVLEEGGKPAITKYRVLATSNGCSLMEVRILTGRTHQIRVHFSNLNHPVLGDPVYGGCPKRVPYLAPRQMLHAWKIVFPHPRTHVMRQYMAPLPEDFLEALRNLDLPVITEHEE